MTERSANRHRDAGAGSAMDPCVEAGSVMDPRVQAGNVMDPRVQAGSAMDPRVQAGSAMDPRVQAGNVTDPRVQAGSTGTEAPRAGSGSAQAPHRPAPRAGRARLRPTTPRAWRRAAALAALALAAAGCGIRGTSVPVDAGPAPSRVSCKAPQVPGGPGAEGAASVPVKVFLVCGSTLTEVTRTVPVPRGGTGTDRLRTARALLDELQERPGRAEEEAGFSTSVPENLEVGAAHPGDPANALRLSVRPEDLPSFALAQIVCTYGGSAALGKTRAAVLGGPDGGPAQRYDCSAGVLAHPDIAQNAGWGRPLSG
ncbi:hypothetical protein [Streptomyces sp. NPDC003077]|uniref:hypothetical protein n=1 Tax=Streptomyces sp. NPDC003077 TaxID=3154443 RepID=UPI0033B36A9B